MKKQEIIELAETVAMQLGLKIKNPSKILKNMKQKIPITTFYHNDNYILWIDKFYICYSSKDSIKVVYVLIQKQHVHEELSSVAKMILDETKSSDLKMLFDLRTQIREADIAMSKSGEDFYIFKNPTVTRVGHEDEEAEESNDPMILTLCTTCASQFYNIPEKRIKSKKHKRAIKKLCTYCNVREGYDYWIH